MERDVKRGAAGLFALSLRLFPESFKSSYSVEMERVFSERISALSPPSIFVVTAVEIFDFVLSAVRAHGTQLVFRRPSIPGIAALALIAIIVGARDIVLRHGAEFPSSADRINFSAHDPAGEFTLTILGGRPVAASINDVPLPPNRLVHSGDSIRFLAPGGQVVLALAYYRATGRIEWRARPRNCPDPVSGCGI